MPMFNGFKSQLLIMQVSGIPVRIDYRWFLVLAIMSWVTAMSVNSLFDNFLISFAFGFLTTLIFFVSIFIHEYAHAFIARLEGMQVVEIVLHPFGGLTRFRREPDTPRAEFRIAIAGPVASFLLALLFLGLMAIFNALEIGFLAPLCFVLVLGNFLLAVFNMFPGYPLDGGRVLRSYLWRRGTNLDDATILTGHFGQIIAGCLIIFGIYIALGRGDFFTGFWTVLIGIFLYDAAKSIIRQVGESEKQIVEEVMSLPFSIGLDITVLHFVDHILPFHRQTVFPVAKNKQLYGVLVLEDLKKLARENWHKTKIIEIMRPITPNYFVESEMPLTEARELMRQNTIGALGVIDKTGNLVGFLQRNKIRQRQK